MKRQLRMVVALAGIILFATIGPAQASKPTQQGPANPLENQSAYPAESWKTGFIDTNASAGTHISMAFDADHDQAAWISYRNETDGGLWAAHYVGAPSGNCGQEDSWWCEAVDQVAGESKGLYTSIDVFPDTNPNPLLTTWKVGISYYDATHKSLKYAQYRCPVLDPCFWTISTVDSSANVSDDFGKYSSMKFDSTGIPHISYHAYYHQTSINSLNHAYLKGGSTGDCGTDNDWQCDGITWGTTDRGLYTALDIDWQDQIYIVHYNEVFGRLEYATSFGADNCGEAGTWHCDSLEYPLEGNEGLFPAVSAPIDAEDLFRVAFYDSTHGELVYATQRDDYHGNCGPANTWQCQTIDDMSPGLSWASISMAVDSTRQPVIAYTDTSGSPIALSLGVAEMADGEAYANCGGGSWWCGRIDSGNTFVERARYAALGIKPDGLAMIAYSSYEKLPPADFDLKFAHQQLWVYLPVTIK